MKGANEDAISNSVSYIESNLLENLDMDELAGQIFFSKTHYQRLFRAIVGEPVMEYIKKRRLQQACQILCQTNANVLEIALEYGYASHEGFTRAFKALYGMTPTQFRKKHAPDIKQKSIFGEAHGMLSNEVTKGISQHTQTIAESLTQFKIDLEKLFTSAEKTAIEVGPNGKGVMVLLRELNGFAAKTGCLIEEVRGFTCEDKSVFEISDWIYTLLKNVDELAFQMNLLRFLSGIEVARMSVDIFAVYQKEITNLSTVLLNHYLMFTNILNGLMSLLLTDIRNESIRSVRSAVDLVNQTARMGKELTEETRKAALELGPNNAGFMQIAAEVEKRTAQATESAVVINSYADNLEKGEGTPDRASVDRSIASLKDIGLTMNLTAFNASVETARAGDYKALADCADKIRNYAFQLHQTYSSCNELFSESIKLSELLIKDRVEYPDSMPHRFQKAMDDIIFQGGILSMQLGMEAQRAQLDAFKQHAEKAESAVKLLSEVRRGNFSQDREALSDYVITISTLTKSCHADAEASKPRGIPFAYITREFDVFVEKMNAVLAKTKQ